MQRSLLTILRDPTSRLPLVLDEADQTANGEIITGTLSNSGGRSFAITNGIPRFVTSDKQQPSQIADSFGFKWQRWGNNQDEASQVWYHNWLRERYGFSSDQELEAFFAGRRQILEVGCGSGMSASLSLSGRGIDQQWTGVDISVAIDVAKERLGQIPNTNFVQADLMQLPFAEKTFDTIFTEGVLHHTPSTEQALKSLLPLLAEGGEILFYVYRKKAPAREFTDDYIRDLIASLTPAEAWEMMRPLTALGQALSELKVQVEVPEDVPLLGIKAGSHDIQRLIYWHFAKLFWNDALSFEENNLVNFDWYHPRYAHRHTAEEIHGWCSDAGLAIKHFDEQESGFTVRAIKSSIS
jgi:arsenite methyltransferase